MEINSTEMDLDGLSMDVEASTAINPTRKRFAIALGIMG
jgi:hypothetical protein